MNFYNNNNNNQRCYDNDFIYSRLYWLLWSVRLNSTHIGTVTSCIMCSELSVSVVIISVTFNCIQIKLSWFNRIILYKEK